MHPASRLHELAARELGPPLAVDAFGFRTSAEVPPLNEFVGQPRALRALETGISLRQPGYHVFAAGVNGTGKMDLIHRTLQDRAGREPPPRDWVYLNNFDDPDQPLAIDLEVGSGIRLRQEMANLVARLVEELPKAFQREEFSREKSSLRAKYRQQGEAIFEELARTAREKDLVIQQVEGGRLMFVALKNGKPISQQEAEQLTPEEVQAIEKNQQDVLDAAQSVFHRQEELERQLNADVRQVERAFAERLVLPLLAEIANRYANPRLTAWLERLKAHFVLNLDRFQRRADRMLQQLEPLVGELAMADLQERFVEYQVNVLVDNSGRTHAPVIVERSPNYRNLFGTIERVVDRFGRVVTNFSRVKAGSMLRANGGYLVFDLLDALAEPFVWRELKRTLMRGTAEIEFHDPFAMFTVAGLKPQPIPLDIKLVVVGTPLLYHLLYHYDEAFREVFRIKADFDTEFASGPADARLFAGLVEKMRQDEGFPPFDAPAIGGLLRASARLAEHQEKRTAVFAAICDVVREAALGAGRQQAALVTADHVRQALDEQLYRGNLLATKIRQLIREGTLLVSLSGSAVGQVNGLSVADLGDSVFGWPLRITASVGLGTAGLVNIERESRLSGKTFDKGLLILEGYLRNQYARSTPLALTASLAIEQSYGKVDGDSASVAELLCLLSAIARVPLRQDVAVTGSIDQWGQVQPIGAVNEKIEGFFDICREVGLSGRQGVCIPAANARHLVLREEVVAAVEQGTFHVWTAAHVDDVIELLAQIPAGEVTAGETFHGRVFAAVGQMGRDLQKHAGWSRERPPDVPPPPDLPDEPRPPFPGQP